VVGWRLLSSEKKFAEIRNRRKKDNNTPNIAGVGRKSQELRALRTGALGADVEGIPAAWGFGRNEQKNIQKSETTESL